MATDTVTSKSELAQTSGQFSTFFVADLFFGVDVLRVQEVLRFQQMTRVPQAPEVIEGLINLRGQIVTAIDMRRRLRLPPRAGEPDANEHGGPHRGWRRQLAGGRDRRRAGCRCRHLRTAARRTSIPRRRDLIRGVYKLKDRLLLVLDAERTVDLASGRA